MTTDTILRRLVGKKVKVFSGQGNTDVGVVEATDGMWVLLRKENGEELYFSAALIRLIKPLDELKPIMR